MKGLHISFWGLYHKLSGVKQHTFALLAVWESQKYENTVLVRRAPFQSLEENSSLPLSQRPGSSLPLLGLCECTHPAVGGRLHMAFFVISSSPLERTPVMASCQSLHHLQRLYFQVHILEFQVAVSLRGCYSTIVHSQSKMVGDSGICV